LGDLKPVVEEKKWGLSEGLKNRIKMIWELSKARFQVVMKEIE